MNPLLIRRRGMMAQGEQLTLLYSNTNVTSSVDTGVKLFEPAISWTILVDCTTNNYNWNQSTSSQGIFGLNGNPKGFRLGKIYQGEGMDSGASTGIANLYFAMSMDSNNTNPKCVTLYGRNNGAVRRAFAIRYDAVNNMLLAVRTGFVNSTKWYHPTSIPSSGNLILLVGGITATIHDIKVYEGVMPDQQMYNYVDSIQ